MSPSALAPDAQLFVTLADATRRVTAYGMPRKTGMP